MVISLESVKKTVQFPAKEDVGDLEVKMMCLEWGWSGKFRFSPEKKPLVAHNRDLKTPGDKGAVDLLYLGVLWGGKVIGKAPEYLCSYVTKGCWSQKLSRSDGPQSWISVLL